MSYGICSAFGVFFGPMHSVLPFLLLGIGLDDMFVIAQSWDSLEIGQAHDMFSRVSEYDFSSTKYYVIFALIFSNSQN